jgi:hypothetical protein
MGGVASGVCGQSAKGAIPSRAVSERTTHLIVDFPAVLFAG